MRSVLSLWACVLSVVSDPLGTFLSLLWRGCVVLDSVGLSRLLRRPRSRWRLPGAYPSRWMLLSFVMLHPTFVSSFHPEPPLTPASPLSLFIPALIALNQGSRPPPWPDPDSLQWGGEWDPQDLATDLAPAFLHRVGFQDEFFDSVASDLKTYSAVVDMRLAPSSRVASSIDSCSTVSFDPTPLSTNATPRHSFWRFVAPLGCSSECSCHSGTPKDIIFDSGASASFTNDLTDFEGPLTPIDARVSGYTEATAATGKGMVVWRMHDTSGKLQFLRTEAIYVPKGRRRLFSPHAHFQQHRGRGKFQLTATTVFYQDPDGWEAEFPLSRLENLPVADVYSPTTSSSGTSPTDHKHSSPDDSANVLGSDLSNLSDSQQELLLWHCRLGHMGFQWLQSLMRPRPPTLPSPCIQPRVPGAATCKAPLCTACLQAKMRRRSTGARATRDTNTHPIRANDLHPGDVVSMDSYESSVRGRLVDTRGREPWHQRLCGGTIFVDHASGFVTAIHQPTLSASDTLLAKRRFEQSARSCGVTVKGYHSDNGVFDAQDFQDELRVLEQTHTKSGVGAHHQNGVAERSIQTVMNSARAMMLHAALHWPKGMDTNLWPLAVDYAVHLWNHTPRRESGVSPMELFCGIKGDCSVLRSARVWGSPAYVLDPKLQDGKKLPKWMPRSRRGQFLGMSSRHSSSIGLVRNLRTGFISPQFHVVYDELFQTVLNAGDAIDSSLWRDLVRHQREYYPDAEDVPPDLADEWLDDADLRRRRDNPRYRSRRPPGPVFPHPSPPASGGVSDDDDDEDGGSPVTVTAPPTIRDSVDPAPIAPPGPTSPSADGDEAEGEGEQEVLLPQDNMDADGDPAESEGAPLSRRNPERAGRGHNPRFHGDEWGTVSTHGGDAFLFYELDQETAATSYTNRILTLLSELSVDQDTGTVGYVHPLALAAKANDADSPTFHEATTGRDSDGFWDAMDLEIRQLASKDCWTVVDRSEAKDKKILGTTWAFKRKRFPDGSVRKLKARICVRGDQQKVGVDVFETFAPVVNWSTVRLMLVLSVALKLHTQQVDYANAFVQAELPKPVYVEMPRGYQQPGKILRLNRSLYGMRDSPLLWFKKCSKGLENRGFKASEHDPCLFINKRRKIACVVWVDDCLYFSVDPKEIDRAIEGLKADGFFVDRELDVAGFLGIQMTHLEDGSIELLQTGLINRVIQALGLEGANTKKTPAEFGALGKDVDGPPREHDWSYPSVVGMLLYLQNNSRPDLTFAVNQCARFSKDPRRSHEVALSRIGRYLCGTRNKGMIIRPCRNMKLDMFVDADWAGLWSYEKPDDPTCVKSRTGYVITLGDVPVCWSSKLQTEIALSTMHAEYVALSTGMRELLPMRALLEQLLNLYDIKREPESTISTVWEDNSACLQLANMPLPRMTPKSKTFAIKYHWFRSHIKQGEIVVKKIESKEQKADIFTKGLRTDQFEDLRKKLLGW